MPELRAATTADVEDMAAVWMRSAFTAYADIFPAEAPKPTLESMVEALGDKPGFVAVEDDRIVGLVQAVDGWLTHLYVDPSYWKRGIGARLHDAALGRIRDDRYTTARLWVLRENHVARAMYERWGWTLTKVIRHVYAPAGIDDVNYIRPL